MERVEHDLLEFDGAAASPDGRRIVLAGRTASSQVEVSLPIETVKELLIALGIALQESGATSAKLRSKATALPVNSLVFAHSKSHPESVFLSVLLTDNGLSVPFLLPKDALVQFCEGALSYFTPTKLRKPVQFSTPQSH